MSELIFATTNSYKFLEASAIFAEFGYTLVEVPDKLVEIQTDSITEIVDRKAKDAFLRVGRPLFVEHTSLHIRYVNGFPGGLTSLILASFGDEKFCEVFGSPDRNEALGQTTIGYCNGRRVLQFAGQMEGRIATSPKGNLLGWEQFGWSRVFVPAGFTQTLSEIGVNAKNKFSMRREAIEAFVKAIK